MDMCTENNECLVLDQTAKSNSVSDCVFWYKAVFPCPNFKVGRRKFHKLSHMRLKSGDGVDGPTAPHGMSKTGMARDDEIDEEDIVRVRYMSHPKTA